MHTSEALVTVMVRSVFRRPSILLAGALLLAAAPSTFAQFYVQSNLVSDVPGVATATDTNLIGAWGITATPKSPWWVNSTMGHVSVIINGAGQPQPLVVAIPPTNNSTVTGITANNDSGFNVGGNMPALFIFVTLNGTISGWSPSQANKNLAILKVDNSATAGYTGVALAQNRLYVANYRDNSVDVFDTNYTKVTLPAGAFSDPKIPAGFNVFNVQLIGNDLYVTYGPTNVFENFGGRGKGYVDVYDTNGTLDRRLQHGFWMNAPWGVVWAPADFGEFSNDVLVGMFGNGAIAGFDPKHGHFRGFLKAPDGLPLRIDPGLWGLGFGNGDGSGPTNVLYFAADFFFAHQFHGLFGTLTAVPEEEGDHDADNGNQKSESERAR